LRHESKEKKRIVAEILFDASQIKSLVQIIIAA